jgi:ribosome-associated translation inhibitor RaiA
VEVYLSDDNGPKATGDDIRCVIEVSPAGGARLAATQHAGDMFAAVDLACETMHRQLADRTDRLHNPKGRTPMGGVPQGASASGGMSQGRRASETE